MKRKCSTVIFVALIVGLVGLLGAISKAEQQVYTFDVCGAPNS